MVAGLTESFSIPFDQNEMDELPEPKTATHEGIPSPFPDLRNEDHQGNVLTEVPTPTEDALSGGPGGSTGFLHASTGIY